MLPSIWNLSQEGIWALLFTLKFRLGEGVAMPQKSKSSWMVQVAARGGGVLGDPARATMLVSVWVKWYPPVTPNHHCEAWAGFGWGVLWCPNFVQKEVRLIESWENRGPGLWEDVCPPGLHLQAALSTAVRVSLAGLSHLRLGEWAFCFYRFSLSLSLSQ